MKKLFILAIVAMGLMAEPAHALLGEVRLTSGNTKGSADDYNKAYYDFADGPQIDSQNYLGADAILMLPMVPVGIGLRYEGAKYDETAFAENVKFAVTRTALLVNYRIINTGVYLGPIVSYGLSHSLTFDIPLSPESWTAGKSESSSIGLEAGVKLGLFRIGAEVGQETFKFTDVRDNTGAIPNKNGLNIDNLDFSGSYYKIHVGLGF